MRALCLALGQPQHRFATLHVVGTNGKSSVTLMTAALLAEAGMRSGACISPHLVRWSERTQIGGAEIEPGAFAAAVERVAETIPAVERSLGDGERITQFEAAIATSFVAFGAADVEVAVIEAGLGGRLDATNVIPSRATALTSVALDHTDWLGDTVGEIAAEKLAVLRPQSALILGGVDPGVADLAWATAAERAAELIEPEPLPAAAVPERFVPYQRRNAEVASALAAVIAGPIGAERTRAALERVPLAGRAQLLAGDPPLVLDAAHNEQGAAALCEALERIELPRPVIGCLSVLADKDAAAIVAAIAPALGAAICTAAEPGPAMGRPGAHAVDPEELSALLGRAGVEAEVIPDPHSAVQATLARAREAGGTALCAGSNYLLRYAGAGAATARD
jgi:dihydrofolate synthase/folylpolyglutamate synthase